MSKHNGLFEMINVALIKSINNDPDFGVPEFRILLKRWIDFLDDLPEDLHFDFEIPIPNEHLASVSEIITTAQLVQEARE